MWQFQRTRTLAFSNLLWFSSGTPLAHPVAPKTNSTTGEPSELTMIGWTSEQRRMLMDKLPDAANLALGALVFGQFLGDRPFSFGVAIGGLLGWIGLLGVAFALGRRKRT